MQGKRLLAGAVLLSALLAVWMDLTPVHRWHNGDSLVPVLVSLYRWTPFYWEQNRFGMLLPLLAMPVEHPFGNLLVQMALRIFAVLLAFFLLARAAVPRACWPAVGALTLALFLGAKGLGEHAFLYMQPYGQAVALSLGGVLLLERRGRLWANAAGAVLLCLGFWIAATTLLWLVPFLLLRWWVGLAPEGEPRRPWPGRLLPRGRELAVLLAVAVAFGLSLLASWLAPFHLTKYGTAPVGTWPLVWSTLLHKAAAYLTPPFLLVLGALLAGVVAVSLRGQWRTALAGRQALATGVVLLGPAAAELLAIGTTRWLQMNHLSLRYFTTGLLLLATAVPAVLLVALLEGRPARWQRTVNALALAVLLGMVAFRYGPPSASRARTALDAGLGRDFRPVVEAGATHVIGNYWQVWPAVYYANLVRWERGEKSPVWGISFRAAPTRPLWWRRDWSRARIAGFPGDPWLRYYQRGYGLPRLYPWQDFATVRVYAAVPRRAATPEAGLIRR